MEQQPCAAYSALQQVGDITKGLPESSTRKTTFCSLEQLCTLCRMPMDIESDQGTHFTGHEVEKWADKNTIHWRFHLP